MNSKYFQTNKEIGFWIFQVFCLKRHHRRTCDRPEAWNIDDTVKFLNNVENIYITLLQTLDYEIKYQYV